MVFLTTETEIEALLLEQNLIKQLKPKYNVLLRDDKFSRYNDFIHPFAGRKSSGNFDEQIFWSCVSLGCKSNLKLYSKIFQLNCTDAMYNSRSRPCLLYQTKISAMRCKISNQDYRSSLNDAELF